MSTYNFAIILFALLAFTSCKPKEKAIVSIKFIDSLMANYAIPEAVKANETEMQFWEKRINNDGFDIVNESKYASTLVSRFHLLGDIKDVKHADSIQMMLAKNFNNKEASPYLALTSNAILQHKFKEAENYLQIAKTIGIRKYETYATAFDVDFENGKIFSASVNLNNINAENDFGYQFRKSKMAHYNGSLDSAIAFMQKATELAAQNNTLKTIALSNVGDLYTHSGELDKAYDSYVLCVKTNNADLHSIMAIGWIALVHDKNDALAEKIFQFVQTKTKSPEPVYKLILMAQQRQDSTLEYKYAKEFETMVADTLYGNMYNKYLIQLYNGVLKNPAKAEAIAKKELDNRATPQTYAWYAFSLLTNNKKDEANAVFKNYISGKPLEGLELYFMGKLMLEFKKGYNAQQYFKEAYKNKYDLSPGIIKDLESELEH